MGMAGTPLIVVALEEEATHLDDRYPVLVTGVGKVAAAVAVTRFLATGEKPSEIINLGTAGALRAGLAGTQEIKMVIQHDFDSPALEALTGHAYGPPITLRADGLVLATGDVFVSDPILRQSLAERADLVDMEGYAVAAAAAEFGVPVRIIKQVSDQADDGAFKSWQATVDECARALATFLHAS
jgi:adenosylhomocysteine nucleosidase